MLSPEQQGNVKSRALMSAGAALLKASGPSPYKNTAFSGIGAGVEGLLSGAQTGTDEALKQQLVRGQISQQQLGILHAAAQYQGMGLPVPPELAHMLKALGLPQSAAQPGGGAPAAPAAPAPPVGAPGIAGAPPMAPGGAPGGAPPMAPGGAPGGAPNLGGAPGALPMAPGAPPAPPLPPSAAGLIRNLPTQDKYALIGGGPAADIVKGVATKNGQMTPGQKDARDPLVAAAAGDVEATKAIASAKAARVADAIKGGGAPAREELNTLDTMADALDHAGDNISTGPGAEAWLKVKQFAKNAGFKVEGLAETEVVSKLNAFLAGEATKLISSRPAQFEFQTYLKNNPGILTSVEGTKKLIDIMRQGTVQKIELSRLAMKQENPHGWQDVEDKFFKENAIKSPFTGKALGSGTAGPNATEAPKPFVGRTASNKAGVKMREVAPDHWELVK